ADRSRAPGVADWSDRRRAAARRRGARRARADRAAPAGAPWSRSTTARARTLPALATTVTPTDRCLICTVERRARNRFRYTPRVLGLRVVSAPLGSTAADASSSAPALVTAAESFLRTHS